jgi:uncharacterized protein YgiB involved in biofilm formation
MVINIWKFVDLLSMRRHLPFVGLCILGFLFCIMPVIAAYTGPCPIGTSGAPALIDPGLPSGAKCRDACGEDCPDERCDLLVDSDGAMQPLVITIQDPRGICTYNNVLECPTHAGCRIHDDCFDACAARGMNSITDSCHMTCNKDCVSKYGLTNCVLWADAPSIIYKGQFTSAMGYIMDYTSGVDFSGYLFFSDPPVFTSVTKTPTKTPTPTKTTLITTTTPKTTLLTTTPKTTTPTESPTITVSGPTVEGTELPLADQRQKCISMGGTWDYSVDACYLPPTTAAPTIGIPDIFQDKPKIQYTADDFKKAAEDAAKNGNNDLAIQYINAAESKASEGYSDKESRPASVDEALSDLEKSRAGVYHNWPGHEAEEKIANDNVKDLQKTADSKSSSFDLPGFEMWAAVLSVMFIFLFRRIKQ